VQALAELMMLVTCAIAIYVGLRTLRIFVRTRGLAELAIGINVLSIAVGGMILTAIGGAGPPEPSVYGEAAYPIGMGFLALHLLAIYWGTWTIFRPRSRRVAGFCVLATIPICIWFVHASENLGSIWVRPVLFQTLRGVGMTWSAFECFHYSDQLMRRATLGLASPLMAHRFWLWAIGATAALVVCTLELLSWGLGEAGFSWRPTGLMVTAGLGVVSALAVALALFPPAAYVRFMAPRLGAAHGSPRAADGEPG